ncbi:hypothetical protein [Nannocystis pusilla]|uniref:Ferritin-like domain-containing protein n=1 Tax=Nannocystis pusilla TaxID=889268 RepID=A0ABS7TK38_9BACT|nr:hypothetical protein [Nannocystis pusilla]MBZ5708593.1 hypothetical protein [Nannocystis pusilla]
MRDAPRSETPIPGPPPDPSRLSTAAVVVTLTPLVGLFVLDIVPVGQEIVGVALLACLPVGLLLGIAALIQHFRSPQLPGIGRAWFATIASLAQIALVASVVDALRHGLHGRVLRWRGRPVLPPVRVLAGPPPPMIGALEPADRLALANHWTRVAREEHASIGAFVRLGAALRHHRAPRALIDAAAVAARQEADHAARCFALASAYAGRSLVAGELPLPDAGPPTLVTLAVEALVDGCVAEGTGAAEAAALVRARSTVGPVHETLAVIARDEAEHAALSHAVLAWCLAVGGEPVRAAVTRAAARLIDHPAPMHGTTNSPVRRAHGMALRFEREAAWQAALASALTRAEEFQRPCAA